MSNSIDPAFERFLHIERDLASAIEVGSNESDTRLKILDRLLFEVLGWKYEAVFTEPPTASGYIDYLLTAGERRGAMVVEGSRRNAVNERRIIARRPRAFHSPRHRPHLQILIGRRSEPLGPRVAGEPRIEVLWLQQHRHPIMDLAHELVGGGDDHRARLQRLTGLDVLPLVPQSRNGRGWPRTANKGLWRSLRF